jgi:hypothetical protein
MLAKGAWQGILSTGWLCVVTTCKPGIDAAGAIADQHHAGMILCNMQCMPATVYCSTTE